MKPEQLNRVLRPILTRMANFLTRSTVQSVDATKPVYIVLSTVRGKDTAEKIPMMQHFGFASVPPKDSDQIRAHLSGDADNPIMIASLDQASQLTDLVAGDSALFDNRGQIIKLTAAGIELINDAGSNIFKSDGSIEFANGAKIDATGDVITATNISLNLHTHIGNLGSPTGPSMP